MLQHPAESTPGTGRVPGVSSLGTWRPPQGYRGGAGAVPRFSQKNTSSPATLRCWHRARGDGAEEKREDLGFLAQNQPLGCGGRALRGDWELGAGGDSGETEARCFLSPTQKARGARGSLLPPTALGTFAPFGGSFCLFDAPRHMELEPSGGERRDGGHRGAGAGGRCRFHQAAEPGGSLPLPAASCWS